MTHLLVIMQAAAPGRGSSSGSGGGLRCMTEGRQLSFTNRLRVFIREEQSCQLQVYSKP